MQLDFYNCPEAGKMDAGILPEQDPGFISYEPDFEKMEEVAAKFRHLKNILVIGHGGSVTSFYGFYHALKSVATKRAYFLNTVDPDYIYELQQTLVPAETLVVAISKSGENTTQVEAFSHFMLNYPLLVVTEPGTPITHIAEKVRAEIVTHPPIGGRYTGFTEVGLLPALLCGFDVRALYKGAREYYEQFRKDNLAWRAASVLWQLEQQGFVDVFMPFYSHNLFPMSALIVQLCHESFGKDGKGQTMLAAEAPESQHHTNQRFFGGQKNIAGLFIGVAHFNNALVTEYPTATHSVAYKGQHLFALNKLALADSMQAELAGTLEDARIQNIPVARLEITSFDPAELGRFTAFWQLYAVYASLLRNVNPYDQPQVEKSKEISFSKRLEKKGLG